MAIRRGSGPLKIRRPSENSPRPPVSILDLVRRAPSFQESLDGRFYSLECDQPLALDITTKGWANLWPHLVAAREHIETQDLIRVVDHPLNREAAYNPLVAHPMSRELSHSVRLRRHRPHPLASVVADGWSDKLTVDCRPDFVAHPRPVRTAIVDSDLSCTSIEESLVPSGNSTAACVWTSVDQFVRQTRNHADFFKCSMHIPGSREQSATESLTIRVQGRRGRHFEFPEAVYRAGSADYLKRCEDVHAKLCLLFTSNDVRVWLVLVPAAKIEVLALPDSLDAGGMALIPFLRVLRPWDVKLSAYVSHKDIDNRRFHDWPSVVWRLLVEDVEDLFPELAADPFIIRDIIRGMAN